MDVGGKRVLVTGASRGIGRALARAFAAKGAAVALVARSEGALRAVAHETGGTVHVADLLDPGQVKRLLHRVEDDAGPVDVLVNNAGIGGTPAPLWEVSDDDIEQVTRLNVTVPLELCRLAIPRMLRRGSGHIVNMASMAALGAVPGMTTYAATKAGLAHAGAALRHELGGLPIGVTTVLVGGVPTEMLHGAENAYPPLHKAFRRLRRLQVMPDTAPDILAEAVVKGVEKERRVVYLPRRLGGMVAAVEAPRRLTELALTGVPRRR